MATRPAGKAGSWYLADPQRLNARLDEYLALVPQSATQQQVPLPVPGARLVIAP